MMSAASLEILLSYVPDIITKRVIQEPEPLSEPTAEAIPAAVFFADISGFTALTERLARKGAVGAEELSDTLNRYFGQLVDIVRFHGGDVVKFAGDALTAIWPTKEHGRSQTHFVEATIRATQCALDAQRKLKDFPTVDGQQLSLKIGLGVGDVIVPYLGGEFGRWEYLITGEPLLQVNAAEGHASPGQIISSPQAWALIEDRFYGEQLPSNHVRIEGVSRPIRPTAAQPLTPPLETEGALKNFIPGAISSRLDAGQAGWLAELRTITVVFAFLPDINHQTPLEEAQEVMLALQKALYRYEGSVNKISVDNKGAMLVAALGLPPFSHEDDAARGALAALAMLKMLKKLGRQAAIGVTTGQTFCGSMGNATRREYTMLGDVVNLSARLMQAALSYGDALPVLCDEATYTAAQSRVEFNKLPPIVVKGKEKPVMIYAPVKEKNQLIGSSAIEGMVGRRDERITILEHLRELLDDEGSTTIIEGEAGIGKSQLIADLAKQAREVGILPLIGAGDAVERATPYFAWRWIFRTLFDVGDLGSTAVVQSKIVKQLATDNYLLQRAPLLNVVLQLGLSDTELTEQMEGEVRASNTRELLVKLLKDAVAENESEPLLILEDVHWFDTASWALLSRLRREIPSMMLVLTTRPMIDTTAVHVDIPAEFVRLRQEAHTTYIRLGPLTMQETTELACQRLGVATLPPEAARLIWQQSEGHPFFSQEIVYTMRETGMVEVQHQQARLVNSISRLNDLGFSSTIQGVINSRIDRLPPGPRLALKVASVIGRTFSLTLLENIYPVVNDRAALPDYLGLLIDLDIINELPETPGTYRFEHIITQEVSYQLLPFAQRQRLHREVAEWLEQTYVLDLASYYPLLAYHWERTLGDNPDHTVALSTINYMEKAGEKSLQEGSYREAIGYFKQAIVFAERMRALAVAESDLLPSYLSDVRRARWLVRVADAHHGLGQSASTRQCCHEALTLLGESFPAERPRLMSGLTQLSTEHAWRMMRPAAVKQLDAEDERQTIDKAHAYNLLTQIYFLSNQPFEAAYAALSGFRLVVQLRPTAELSELYAMMYGVFKRLRLSRVAETYTEQAQAIANELNHRPALAFSLLMAALFKFGDAPWSEIQSLVNRSIKVSDDIGDKRRLGDGLSALGYVLLFRGEYIQGTGNGLRLYESGVSSDNVEHQAWGFYGQGVHLLRLGQTEEAERYLEKALALLKMVDSRAVEAAAYGMIAVIRLRQGDLRAAQHAAKRAGEMADTPLPMSVMLFTAFSSMCEVFLNLWERSVQLNASDTIQMQALALQGVEMVERYARFNPEGKPRALTQRGWADWLLGKQRSARQTWQNALDLATELGMPYEQGLASYEIGRHAHPDSTEFVQYLRQALTIFRRLGAMYETSLVRALLNEE